MKPLFKITLPGLPPSVNHVYLTVHGKRILSKKEGAAYKTSVQAAIALNSILNRESISPAAALTLVVVLEVPESKLLNKGWPKTIKTRYKRYDASNRVKVLEDVISTALGYDDGQNFTVVVAKVVSSDDKERTHVSLTEEDTCNDPIKSAIWSVLGG